VLGQRLTGCDGERPRVDPVLVAAGYLRELALGEHGLAQLGASLHRHRLADDLWGQLVDLAPAAGTAMTRLVLPGFTDTAQARTWTQPNGPDHQSGWEQLATMFTSLTTGEHYDVIADCGRLAAQHPPAPVVAAADLVLVVLRCQLPAIRATATAVTALRQAGQTRLGLVCVGVGPYDPAECAEQLDVPLLAHLPDDPGSAGVLSHGGRYHRGRLLRAAARAETRIRTFLTDAPPVDAARPAGTVAHAR
jgi:hypothetical protein